MDKGPGPTDTQKKKRRKAGAGIAPGIAFGVALSLAVTLALPGCTRPDPATDQWLGQWNGPEGTFLRVDGGKGKYEITLQNLDGPQVFHGVAAGDRIKFDRHGVEEFLRATNGEATGMKWLSEKSDCLTVRPGEGYCRK